MGVGGGVKQEFLPNDKHIWGTFTYDVILEPINPRVFAFWAYSEEMVYRGICGNVKIHLLTI